jgi:Icc-related predicted phosphoesterase
VNAGSFYKVDVLILGGDITGKAIIPILKQKDGTFKSKFQGEEFILRTQSDLEKFEKFIHDTGYYTYRTTLSEWEELVADEEKLHEKYINLAVERLKMVAVR